jgi:hypothetical protein
MVKVHVKAHTRKPPKKNKGAGEEFKKKNEQAAREFKKRM